MKDRVLKKIETLQKTKSDLLDSLSGLSEEELNKKPEEGKWSPAQVLFHIYLAENLSLQYMKKKSSDLKQLKPSGLKENVKSVFLSILLALPIKYKAPRSVSESLPEEIEWERFLKSWTNTRSELYTFINSLPEEALQKNIFKHPRTGMMNINQTLSFYQSHFDHHLPQVKSHL